MSFLTKSNANSKPALMDPWNWSSDIDRYFAETMKRMGLSEASNMSELQSWAPKVNVIETDKEFKVEAELPGMQEKDIDVTFQDNTLTIKGEKRFEKKDEKENYLRVETNYGSFQRVMPFTTKIDEDKIKAEFENGVLKIALGKSDDVVNKTRKIKISK